MTHEDDVDAATLAYEYDPTPEHERVLREVLREGGATDHQIDRYVREVHKPLIPPRS